MAYIINYSTTDKINPNLHPAFSQSFIWTTEPPTKEGFYWAKSESVEIVRVSNDYPDTDIGLRVWSTWEVGARSLDEFKAWLGPLPKPELAKG